MVCLEEENEYSTPDKHIAVLFDMDGTLTPSRQTASESMLNVLKMLRKKVTVGIVSGSNESKLIEQLGQGKNIFNYTDYLFPENGTIAKYRGESLGKDSTIKEYLGEDNLKKLIRFILHYIADLDIPIKRGTFIEYRSGLINISPIGRNCSATERHNFYLYNQKEQILQTFAENLRKEFSYLNLTFSIGGQISIDCFPIGWDKRFCLNHLSDRNFSKIFFIGDKTIPGGNDYEIYADSRTIGYSVKSPEETISLIKTLFFSETE